MRRAGTVPLYPWPMDIVIPILLQIPSVPRPHSPLPPRQWLKPSRRQAAEHRHRHRHLSATKFHTASNRTGKDDLHHRNHPNASLELANPHEFQPPQSELPALLPDRDAVILNPWSRREASFPHKNFRLRFLDRTAPHSSPIPVLRAS